MLTFLALPLGTSYGCPSFEFLHLSGVISSLSSDASRLDKTQIINFLVAYQNSLTAAVKSRAVVEAFCNTKTVMLNCSPQPAG